MNTFRKQHYKFAYFTLPLFALSNTNDTFKKLNRNDRLVYLKTIWNGLGNKTNDHIPDQGLNCSKINLEYDIVLFVIQLPKPEIQPEAFFVGLIFWVETGFLVTKATKAKCFTLELSCDVKTNREVYVIGESVPGQPFPSFDHKNYGSINSKDKKSFILAIQAVLSGKKFSDIGVLSSNVENKIHGKDGAPKEDSLPGITEDDLNKLWSKWTNYPVDDQIERLCLDAVKPLEDLLQDLGQSCLKENIYPTQQAGKIGEWSGYALARLSRGSFMVGLEYPDFRTDRTNFKKEKAYQLMEVASKTSEDVLKLFLSQLVEHGKLPTLEAGRIAENGGKLILNGMAGCFFIGAKLSPQKQFGRLNNDLGRQQEHLGQQHSRVSPEQLPPEAEIMIMIECLRDIKSRPSAIQDLIAVGDRAIPILQPLLRDINPDVRLAALKILSEIEKSKL